MSKKPKKKKSTRKSRGHACDSLWLRDAMFAKKLNVSQLATACGQAIDDIANENGGRRLKQDVDTDTIHALLREDGRYVDRLYIVVARALDLDDWECLTRRNQLTHKLGDRDEKNFYITLVNMIVMRVLPEKLYNQRTCLLDFLYHGDWEDLFGSIDIGRPGFCRIVDALCPAGMCIRRGDRYLILEPNTEQMLRRSISRRRRLQESIEDLWSEYYTRTAGDGYEHRRAIGDRIADILVEMKEVQKKVGFSDEDDHHYAGLDINWQIELTADGDPVLYETMLALTPSCHQTLNYLDSLHSREPLLPWDDDFMMLHKEWREKWNHCNTDLVSQLAEALAEEDTTPQDLIVITNAIIEHTLLNIQAADNALRQHRFGRTARRRYPGIKWEVTTGGESTST